MDNNTTNEVNIEKTVEKKAPQQEVQAIKTTEFMKETIKQRPINKRKLLRRLFLTVAMAVVFGLVACVTFIFLEPLISAKLHPVTEPHEQVQQISLVEETVDEETAPEDMIVDESELAPVIIEQAPLDDEQIEQVLSEMELGITDYLSLTNAIADLAKTTSSSLVSVIAISQDKDLFSNEYESENVVSGVVIADNGVEILILSDFNSLSFSDEYEIMFPDGLSYEASIKTQDSVSGITILAVRKDIMKTSTREALSIVNLGTTVNRELNGSPIFVLGRPLGTDSSMCVGRITSCTGIINLPDASYNYLTTDIFGSSAASGFVFNLHGQLIGIVDMTHNSSDMKNMIWAYAISDMKSLIEHLGNGLETAYLGLFGLDVTPEIAEEMGLPEGVYISSLEMDSPALEAGIKSGDVICKINGTEVKSQSEITRLLLLSAPGDEMIIDVKRMGLEGFTDYSYTVILGN